MSARQYDAAFVENGPRAYADNVDAGVEALTVDGILLPLVVNRGSKGAAICSPYCATFPTRSRRPENAILRCRPGCLRRR